MKVTTVLVVAVAMLLAPSVLAASVSVSMPDSSGAKGSTVVVPINLEGASNVGSMDITVQYNPQVLRAVSVENGGLGSGAFIEGNTESAGSVLIALADSSGINGNGAIAEISFEVIGAVGSTSELYLEVTANDVDTLVDIITNIDSGTFEVVEKGGLGGLGLGIIAVIALIIALALILFRKRSGVSKEK